VYFRGFRLLLQVLTTKNSKNPSGSSWERRHPAGKAWLHAKTTLIKILFRTLRVHCRQEAGAPGFTGFVIE
jgi:hypothetical protein